MDFVVNAPYPRILELLSEASIGVNTMVDEHFGINVVEFMVGAIFPNVIRQTAMNLDLGRRRNTHRARVRWTAT